MHISRRLLHYAVAAFRNPQTLSSSHICLLQFISQTLTYVTLQSSTSVKTVVADLHERINVVWLQAEGL